MDGEVVLLSLWVVTLPLLEVLVDWLLVPVLLLWATANAPAATKTNKIPGIRVIRISSYQYLLWRHVVVAAGFPLLHHDVVEQRAGGLSIQALGYEAGGVNVGEGGE